MVVLVAAAGRAAATKVALRCAVRVGVAEASTSYLPRVASMPRSARLLSMSRPVLQPTQKYSASPISDGQYQQLSNGVLDTLTEHFEALLEEADLSGDAQEWDIECASGVLNLRCGSHGTYVINKQPPNKQIWLSSPKSGPKRFDYDAEQHTWFCLKEGQLHTLKQVLDSELQDVFALPVNLPITNTI